MKSAMKWLGLAAMLAGVMAGCVITQYTVLDQGNAAHTWVGAMTRGQLRIMNCDATSGAPRCWFTQEQGQ
jgi:hypothetical protein